MMTLVPRVRQVWGPLGPSQLADADPAACSRQAELENDCPWALASAGRRLQPLAAAWRRRGRLLARGWVRQEQQMVQRRAA